MTRTATSPGEILRDEFMKPRRLGVTALATALDMPAGKLLGILLGQRPISNQSAACLACFFDTTVGFWTNLQVNYDLSTPPRPRRRRTQTA